MSENYTVNYNINVNANAATQALTSFQTATNNLTKASNNLKNFEKQIQKTLGAFSKLSKKAPKIDFSTYDAKRKLNDIIRKLERINTLASKKHTIIINEKVQAQTTGTGTTQRGRTGTATSGRSVARSSSGSMSYKVLGPAMIDTGGIGAIDMLKGMGIAYGITGLGTLLSNAIKDASNYDNLMQTTRNILETHDKDKASFAGRFSSMEHLARYIGISTKYTAPEVADMTKFLAMAGMDINAINHAMNPIANVALIGDTELGKTADLVTNIMTGYGIKPENVGRATDIMAMTFTSANTTLTEIAEAYKYSASLLAAADVSFEEATAALGILGNAGIKGSQGGTSLRTILANVVNPRSKKREAAWDEIGVKRFNADGSMRSLTDIFQELHDKNLGPEMYYKLFDRTAAQGAVSLAANIQEWNNIIDRNFLSDGVAQSLADKKKNTIQGLWYQMTSTFTEQAMKVFEDMESPIRKFLVDIRKWIQTDDFKKSLKSVSEALMDLMKMFLSFTKTLISFYNRFSGVIKLWLKWQLHLSAILVPLRTMKSLFNFTKWIIPGVNTMKSLTTYFGLFLRQLKQGQGLRYVWQSFWTPSAGTGTTGAVGGPGNRRHRSLTMLGAGGAIGSIVGTVAGGLLGSQIGETGSLLNTGASLLGSAVGAWAVPKIISMFGASASMGPIGIGIGIAAVLAGGIAWFVKWRKEVNKCTEEHNKFLTSMTSINGINYSENASKADKYLAIIYNKQIDINQAISKHILLMREQMGVMDEAKSGTETFAQTNKEELDGMSKHYRLRSRDNKWKHALRDIYNEDGSVNQSVHATTKRWWDAAKSWRQVGYFNDVTFSLPEELEVARNLYLKGSDTSDGSILRKKIDETNNRLLRATSVAAFDAIINDLNAYSDGLKITPNSQTWGFDDLKSSTNWQQNYHYVTAQRHTLRDQFVGNTANASMLRTWREILGLYEAGQKVPDSLLQKFLMENGVVAFDKGKTGAEFGSDEFMRHFGWRDGRWGTLTYDTEKVDDKGNKIFGELTEKEAQNHFLLFLQEVNDIVSGMDTELKPIFDGILNHPVWGYGKKTDSKIVTYNGHDYVLKEDGMYYPLDNMTLKPMSKIEMAEATANQNTNGGTTVTTETPDPKDYKNHYSSNSAAPKQVIVRIGNLMNVESIDMTNPNNAAVINDIKGQLAQVLIDVVHDFDATWNA